MDNRTYFEDIVGLYLRDNTSFDAETLYLAAHNYPGCRDFAITDADCAIIWQAINKKLKVDVASTEATKSCLVVNSSNGKIESFAPDTYRLMSFTNEENCYLASKFVTSYKSPNLNLESHLADLSYFWGGDGKLVPKFDCVILESWDVYPYYKHIDGDFNMRQLLSKDYYIKRCMNMVNEGGLLITFLDENDDLTWFDDIFSLKNKKLAIKYY